ncbi:TPA: fimbrial biogenesis outer membrane usher protein [Citrobacter farmeri]|nr:fimbrial biogenesis outer membrane usher protein [Citrobacter farmeri]
MIFPFKLRYLTYIISVAIASPVQSIYAREYFNPALLEIDNPGMKGADLSSFEEGSQAPGKYRVDVLINNQMVDTQDLEFTAVKTKNNNTQLQPCLSIALLQKWGVKTQLFPILGKGDQCVNLAVIPQASATFLFNAQRLALSIPQAALTPSARGYVAPELWDEGVPALLLNYSLSGDHTEARNSSGGNTDSKYANLRPGLNIGAWRLRNYTTWLQDDRGHNKWDTIYTYLQRNIVALKSQLIIGDSSSPSDVFDSIPFRGAQLATDDDMLPESLKGYAPVVRGIARTNAQVIIRQNGYVIYQSYVAPGAFEITDMYPTGGSGDLNVTIKEADGSTQNFVVPFASVAILQREGHLKYSITGGQYRSYNSGVDKTSMAQATAIYGLSHGITVYGGIQASSPYRALAIGLGNNMGTIGALSVDVIAARSEPKDVEKSDGRSWRVRYSKDFTETGTNFAIAGYRYSTSGFYSMQEVMDSFGDSAALNDRRRNRAEVTVSQSLGQDLGSLTFSGLKEDYWNSDQRLSSYSVGYNNSWRGISYAINYTYSKNARVVDDNNNRSITDKDQIVSLNVSVPLERFLPGTWANYSLNSSKEGNTTHAIGLSGTALESNALSWNVQQGYGTDDAEYTGSLNADYRGTYGEMLGGYGYDKNSQRIHMGLNGGILAHAGGITLAQPFGETIALVEAPGVNGVHVNNQTGVHTDFRGYTVVSNVSPYRQNQLALDTATLPDDVELDLTSKTVIPTRGAVVRASYKANIGMRILMTLNLANGQPVPFGATVSPEGAGNAQGFIVGDAGQVYLSGMPSEGNLRVTWGNGSDRNCRVSYSLKPSEQNSNLHISSSVCQ